MGLETYNQKRNFERTSEPKGRQSRRNGYSFVVQKHDARRLHYDFRLELGGVLLSWAVPKGPSLDPKVKRLAMQTEDHPLDYGDFEGVIPKGEYGGGTVLLWDQGTWEPEGDAEEMYRRGRLSFELHGQKLHGGFALVRTASGGNKDDRRWLLFKRSDEAALPGSDAEVLSAHPESVASGREIEAIASDPDHVWTSKATAASHTAAAPVTKPLSSRDDVVRAELPEFVEPQLATLVKEAPEGDEWLHEIKLDGYRILARLDGGKVQLASRRGNDWTVRMPSIASALGRVPVPSALLDGEVVVLGENGVSNFQRLQNSMDAGRDRDCVYYVFDAPFLDGYDLRQMPLVERKVLLSGLIERANNPRVRYSDHVAGGGPRFFARACELGLEGIISKRADSAYTSTRGRSWLKVKCLSLQEFVVGGFTQPEGSRQHLGALLVGVRDKGKLVYAGKVGTGFTQASLADLAARLEPLTRDEPPFSNPPKGAERRGVHWVEPSVVVQVAFVERTEDGMIRHASFQGLREDKAPADVELERPAPGPGARKSTKPAKVAQAKVTKTKGKKSTAKAGTATPGKAKATKAAATKAAKTAGSGAAPKRPSTKAAPRLELDVSRIEITHPDRVVYPDQGLTKSDLMLHYTRVAPFMLPHVIDRPLMLVRCPAGEGEQCFHQKHPSAGMPKAVQQVMVPQKKGPEANLMIRDVEGLLGLVQMGALEIHTWGCRAEKLDCPDQLVFDLDPDVGLPWERVVEAAQTLRTRLDAVGLTGFVKLTGGKGLHVVIPVEPSTPWDVAKQWSKQLADAMVNAEPDKYLATMTKQKRKGKLFLDYFRNGIGATAVCAFSTRARAGAPVSVTITWEELEDGIQANAFNVKNLPQRLDALRQDPWEGFDDARAPIPKASRR
jgi:bifunctional non-homologous end joining protein LigD